MTGRPPPTLADSIASAQDWWREAGVDFAFNDEPACWLEAAEPDAAPPPVAPDAPQPVAPAQPAIGGDRAAWPVDFAGFSPWWLSEPSLDSGGTHPRLPPRGAAEADLLMLVPMPEDGDHDTLLAGPHGRLLASFARAAGLAPESVTVAAALARHAPLPDWERLATRGYGDVMLHLLTLARPKRLIVFGRNILPLLGHAPAQSSHVISELAIQGRAVPLLATYAPEHLLAKSGLRAELWRRWLGWTDGEST